MGIAERKEREKERRRQQIMLAAKRVFSAKGFNKSTMEDIAAEAELSPGTIYLYFKNKDELYASLTLRVLQYMLIRFEHVSMQRNLNSEDRIAALREAMVDIYEFDALVLVNMFRLQSSETLKNLSSELLSQIKELSRKSLLTMANIFKEGIHSGNFADRHPMALADIALSLFSGVVLWEESKRTLNENKNYLRETLETAFHIFAKGIQRQDNLMSEKIAS